MKNNYLIYRCTQTEIFKISTTFFVFQIWWFFFFLYLYNIIFGLSGQWIKNTSQMNNADYIALKTGTRRGGEQRKNRPSPVLLWDLPTRNLIHLYRRLGPLYIILLLCASCAVKRRRYYHNFSRTMRETNGIIRIIILILSYIQVFIIYLCVGIQRDCFIIRRFLF